VAKVIRATPLVRGDASGKALVGREPLSFWGGYDYHTGEIIDPHHHLRGRLAGGRILAIPYARGSSTTTEVLLEAVRAGTAPAAILTTGIDSFFVLASIVAEEMYGRSIPIVALEPADFKILQDDQWVQVSEDGVITVDAERKDA
jgi:predicted aconitase with swiveling domain